MRRGGRLGHRQKGVGVSNRAYDLTRTIVERRGGSVFYERAGYRYGAWVIRLGEHSTVIDAGTVRYAPRAISVSAA